MKSFFVDLCFVGFLCFEQICSTNFKGFFYYKNSVQNFTFIIFLHFFREPKRLKSLHMINIFKYWRFWNHHLEYLKHFHTIFYLYNFVKLKCFSSSIYFGGKDLLSSVSNTYFYDWELTFLYFSDLLKEDFFSWINKIFYPNFF